MSGGPQILKRFLKVGFGLALCGGVAVIAGPAALENLTHIDYAIAGFAIAATFGITMLSTLRWRGLSIWISDKPIANLGAFYHTYMMSRLGGLVLPRDAAEMGGRFFWLNRFHDVPASQAACAIFLDRVFDFAAVATLLAGSLPFWLGWLNAAQTVYVVLSLVGLSFLVFAVPGKTAEAVFEFITEYLVRLVRKLPFIPEIPESSQLRQVDRRQLIGWWWFSLIKAGFVAARAILIALIFGLDIPSSLLFVVAPLGQLAYAAAITPGALGIFEAGWFGILVFVSVSPEVAGTFILGQRTVMILALLVLSVFSTLASELFKPSLKR